MIKGKYKIFLFRFILIAISLLFLSIVNSPNYKKTNIEIGSEYETIKELYLVGTYEDLEKKNIRNSVTVMSYIETTRPYKSREVSFILKIEVGTVVTTLNHKELGFNVPFFFDHYRVKINPDISQGTSIRLSLFSRFIGDMNDLNPSIFKKIN